MTAASARLGESDNTGFEKPSGRITVIQTRFQWDRRTPVRAMQSTGRSKPQRRGQRENH
jgi:hypothetical protein